MVLRNTCLLCWYAYLALIHFLRASPKMFRHGQELTERGKIFFVMVLDPKETVQGARGYIFKKKVCHETLTTF